MDYVFGFVHVPDFYHCLSPVFRKLVSAILRSLYLRANLSKNVLSNLHAASKGRYSAKDKNLTLYS